MTMAKGIAGIGVDGRWLLALLAVVLLAGCAAQAPPSPQIGNINPVESASWWGDWAWWCFAGLTLSTLIVALGYMGGSFLRSPETLAWCKVELYQIAMTAMMVTGFVLLVWTLGSLDTSIIGIKCSVPLDPNIATPAAAAAGTYSQTDPSTWQPVVPVALTQGCNMFDFSMVYLKWMRQQTWIIYQRFLLMYQKYAFQTSITYGAAMGGIGPVLQPMVFLQPVLNYIIVQINFIAPQMVLILVLIELMRYIQFGMLNIVLPVGVVCRCFSPLRNFGGALMGMSIALFLFFPFLLSLNAAVLMPSQVIDPSTGQLTRYYSDEIAFENGMNTVTTNIDEKNLVGLDAIIQNEPITVNSINDQGDKAKVMNDLQAGLDKWGGGTWYEIGVLLDGIVPGFMNFSSTQVIFGALVLPILDFLLIITAARDLSRFLGEEVDVTNLTRMI
ncbi:Uncharacterised protein [Candidatus Burarchaeum australiense]|nr:Uncharacterised protein [Candidatus Burarchaeum australiense]